MFVDQSNSPALVLKPFLMCAGKPAMTTLPDGVLKPMVNPDYGAFREYLEIYNSQRLSQNLPPVDATKPQARRFLDLFPQFRLQPQYRKDYPYVNPAWKHSACKAA